VGEGGGAAQEEIELVEEGGDAAQEEIESVGEGGEAAQRGAQGVPDTSPDIAWVTGALLMVAPIRYVGNEGNAME
jgi:hypothetical protein